MKDLDLMFRELRTTEPYLNDNGFTAVVMAQLPAQRELPMWVKNLLLLGATLLGSAIVATQLPANTLGTVLVSLATLPAIDAQSLLSVAAQNLPAVLLGCFAVSYLVPYGAILAVRRGAI